MPDSASTYDDDFIDDEELLSEEERADLDRPLHEIFGAKQNYAPDEESPPVDEGRLLALCRNQVSMEEREDLIGLIATYRPWLRAWSKAMARTVMED